MPAPISRAFSQAGDSPSVTSRKTRAMKRGHASRSSIASANGSSPSRAGSVPGTGRELGAGQRGDLARDPVDRRQVGPVVERLDLEHVVAERQHVGERRAGLELVGEHHDPAVVGAELELALRQDHPVGHLAAQLPLLDPEVAAGITAPGVTTATVAPAPKFHAPQTIERGSPSPTSTFVSWSLSAFGCLPASSTLPTTKCPKLPSASATPRRTMRSTSQLVKTSRRASSSTGSVELDVLAEPGDGDLHQNCPRIAEVVLPERAQVGQAVPEHGDALDPEAEREALPLVRVEADVAEHVGVDPAGAAHLDPAGVLAHRAALAVAEEAGDVELDRRLGEREEARAHAHLALRPEQLAEELQHRAAQVGERDPAVDGEALDLLERRRVRRVRRVAPVDATRRDHVDRRLPRQHRLDLVGRGLRAQDRVVVEVEGVELRPRRVAVVGVERVEVLPDGDDLGAVPDLVAHAEEDVLDLAADLRQQVEPAARDRRAGDRHVDAAVGGRLVGRRAASSLLARGDRRPRAARGSPFRSMPLSRSRTPRSACASSDLRPR